MSAFSQGREGEEEKEQLSICWRGSGTVFLFYTFTKNILKCTFSRELFACPAPCPIGPAHLGPLALGANGDGGWGRMNNGPLRCSWPETM